MRIQQQWASLACFNCSAFIHLNDWHKNKRQRKAENREGLLFAFSWQFNARTLVSLSTFSISQKPLFNGFKFNWMCKQRRKFLHFSQSMWKFFAMNVLLQSETSFKLWASLQADFHKLGEIPRKNGKQSCLIEEHFQDFNCRFLIASFKF